MTLINVHSQNLRGSLKGSIDWIVERLNDPDCECTAILIQDFGLTDSEGSPLRCDALKDHKILAHFAENNKARTVAIIVHKSWEVRHTYRDKSGAALGAVIGKDNLQLLVICAYLPASLDLYGLPSSWDPTDTRQCAVVPGEASCTYASIYNWTQAHPIWILGGDLNETRSLIDRSRVRNTGNAKKFIDGFLEDSRGIDIWRHLYPTSPGFTYRNQSKHVQSRIDYFVSSPLLFQTAKSLNMKIGHWESVKDHCRISISLTLPTIPKQNEMFGKPWSIPQPELRHIPTDKVALCRAVINQTLEPLLTKFSENLLTSPTKLQSADNFSKKVATKIVQLVGSIVGMKRGTHKKGQFETLPITKAKAELSTLRKARDLIRTLYQKEFRADEKNDIELHLKVCLDRLLVLGLASLPTSLDIDILNDWSERTARQDIFHIEKFIRDQKQDIISQNSESRRQMFLDPKKRGKWFSDTYCSPPAQCPNFVVDPEGKKVYNAEKVKDMYLQEGASFLRHKIHLPPPHNPKEHKPPTPPPKLNEERQSIPPKPKSLPKWWASMYSRQAKGIPSTAWSTLMAPVDRQEVLKTIKGSGTEKAAGYDGVSSDLVRLLANEPTDILLNILVVLINTAFENGQTLPSWRKAIISMIPKRKEDGSFTESVSEMRPISVLQEFGKIASKILSDRLGEIFLANPGFITSSQRAFLKNGDTSQCINVVLNVFEDFHEKKKKKQSSQLFMMAYDQVKAYDCVQSYTIRASLERFNFPENFIQYVLSNLVNATSCFKTFYGPTPEIPVEASVRQGDPLSPLIYICVTDALHAGFNTNPLYGCRTGYTFSNSPKLMVSSSGYADDTTIFSESWGSQWMMHEWIRDFCHVHKFKLNSIKCKYVISDCKGEMDQRWLPSVDGKERITPRPSSFQFRHLGLWISMDLNWSTQIKLMTKQIMDWRWKSLIRKVDPAQLRVSVLEWLIPRMELGLLHAKITEKMCDGWLSTIIDTICRQANMSTSKSINRKAFCLLARIPDLWMRTQTIRATELIVKLNTVHCPSGDTTRARFCSFMGYKYIDTKEAISAFENKGNFNTRASHRCSSTLRYLKRNDLTIANCGKGAKAPTRLTSLISKSLLETKDVIVYTDGSTNPQSTCANSGCSVVITNTEHKVLWQGGMTVRTDGNNFLAELAAVACTVRALPPNVSMTLRTDSQAVIGAISKGPVSERKRIRAPGRVWLNLCRNDLQTKRARIHLEHVSAHKGTNLPEHIGNDNADRLAKAFRNLGECRSPVKYFTASEEAVLLKHKDQIIQGDPRLYLKNMETQLMLKVWKDKSPKQTQYIDAHPTQITRQAKRVWHWALEAGDGKAWIFFIFAVCQWLPTNRRLYYEDDSLFDREKCQLCSTGLIEDIQHVFRCPALAEEREKLRIVADNKLKEWKLPFAHKQMKDLESSTVEILQKKTLYSLTTDRERAILSPDIVERIARDFWRTHSHKRRIPRNLFVPKVRGLIPKCICSLTTPHSCGRPNIAQIPYSLTQILVRLLNLTVEGNTSILARNPLFSEWCGLFPQETFFGSIGSFMETDLSGKNIFLRCIKKEEFEVYLPKILSLMKSKKPTRILTITRSSCLESFHDRSSFELARMRSGFSVNYAEVSHIDQVVENCEVSLLLSINRESLLIDPINWDQLKRDLSGWANETKINLEIRQSTEKLFLERTMPTHSARTSTKQESKNPSIYHFFDPQYPQATELEHLLQHGIPFEIAKKIDSVNNHSALLSLLGILPNKLRLLLKESNHTEYDRAFEDISKTLFWQGYSLWSKRKLLSSHFWKNIAPEEWKPHKKEHKNAKKRSDAKIASLCTNPFHFLRKYTDLSKQRPTRCFCSRVQTSSPVHRFLNLVTYFSNLNNSRPIVSREDLIRGAHDLAKCNSDDHKI